ncbi:MAG TPA: hypothetical protein VF342_03525 [Alphaproteobacteria bacterium]
MSLHIDAFGRDYDLHLLMAVPSTLNLFPSAALANQFQAMARQRRALCFTVIVPAQAAAVHNGHAGIGRTDREDRRASTATGTAAVLVCLHVAPEIAVRGPGVIIEQLANMAKADLRPVHQLSAPFGTRPEDAMTSAGFYREAVYEGGAELYVSITTHTPVEIPAEAADTVARATRGFSIDMVTTIAITAEPPLQRSGLWRSAAPESRTIH